MLFSVVTMLPALVSGDFFITVLSPCSHCCVGDCWDGVLLVGSLMYLSCRNMYNTLGADPGWSGVWDDWYTMSLICAV